MQKTEKACECGGTMKNFGINDPASLTVRLTCQDCGKSATVKQ